MVYKVWFKGSKGWEMWDVYRSFAAARGAMRFLMIDTTVSAASIEVERAA